MEDEQRSRVATVTAHDRAAEQPATSAPTELPAARSEPTAPPTQQPEPMPKLAW